MTSAWVFFYMSSHNGILLLMCLLKPFSQRKVELQSKEKQPKATKTHADSVQCLNKKTINLFPLIVFLVCAHRNVCFSPPLCPFALWCRKQDRWEGNVIAHTLLKVRPVYNNAQSQHFFSLNVLIYPPCAHPGS